MEDKLRLWVSEDFGLELDELTPVHHGADVAAEVWQARTTSDDLYAVKCSGAAPTQGHKRRLT